MEIKDLVKRLQNMADITTDVEFHDTLVEASETLLELEKRSMTISVTISPDKLKDVIATAFENCIGKDFEYVVQAVKEKMEREGELYGEEEAQEQTDA